MPEEGDVRAKRGNFMENIEAFKAKLEKRIDSTDTERRRKCVHEIIKHMNSDDTYIVETTEYLVRLLKDRDPGVRMEALSALEGLAKTIISRIKKNKEFMVNYNGKKVPLRKLLFYNAIQRTKDPVSEIRREAVKIAGEKSLEFKLIREKAVPFLVARLTDEDKETRNLAVGYLIKVTLISPELTTPYLKRLFSGGQKNTDRFIAYILDKVSARMTIPEFIPLLFQKLKIADSVSERLIISILARCGLRDINRIRAQLIEGMADDSYALWWITARNMLSIIQRLAEEKMDEMRAFLRHIIPLMESENWELRKEAALTVGIIGKGSVERVMEAIPALIELTRDPDDMAADAAITALNRIGVREIEYLKVRDAASTLTKARIYIERIKKNGDLNKRIAEAYSRGKKAFRRREYERAHRYALAALEPAKTRAELKDHAEEAIGASMKILERAKNYGHEGKKISQLLEEANKAYEEHRYFLARELVARASDLLDRVKPITRLGIPHIIETSSESFGETTICNHCGAVIPREATICPRCGARLGSTVCPNCHSLVPEGSLFCGKCGARIDNACPVCGAINPPGSTVCRRCGEPLGGAGVSLIPHNQRHYHDDEELDVELVPLDKDLSV